MEHLAEAGPELAVEAGAANLEQEIGTAAGPAHLLGFGHLDVRCSGSSQKTSSRCLRSKGSTKFVYHFSG
jgi:hypothetical protein